MSEIIIIKTTVGQRAVSAKYRGGAYIDLFWGDHALRAAAEPFEVINVWDYAAGERTIRFSQAGVQHAVQEWYADQGESARERQASMKAYWDNAGSRD